MLPALPEGPANVAGATAAMAAEMTTENPRMSDGNRSACLCNAGRPSNDELDALMAGVIKRQKGAIEQLHLRVRPLVTAFYEGQVQAGRVPAEELEVLVHHTLWAIYQRRASYDRRHPFRAWLLHVARGALLERGTRGTTGHWQANKANAALCHSLEAAKA